MSSANQVQIVLLQELRDNIGTKSIGDTTIIFTPAHDLLVGIGPEEITEQTRVGDVSRADDTLDLIERVQLGGQTTVPESDFRMSSKNRTDNKIESGSR